jgi:hypothetical protein
VTPWLEYMASQNEGGGSMQCISELRAASECKPWLFITRMLALVRGKFDE